MKGKLLKQGFWAGAGLKGGGTAAVAGLEDTEGILLNLNNINDSYGFGISGFRLGVGLGVTAGVTAVFAFDCPSIEVLDGMPSSDWGFNFSLGEKWSSILKGLTEYKLFATIAKLATLGNQINPEEFENLRNAASYLYTAAGGIPSGIPKMIALDIPGLGVGTEVSLHWVWSEFRLYEEGILHKAERLAGEAKSKASR